MFLRKRVQNERRLSGSGHGAGGRDPECSFAAPTKYATRWEWENIWAVWAAVALFLAPWLLACATVPGLFGIYRDSELRLLLLPVGFGAGFGIAQILFGLSLAAIGLSLGFAVTIGLSTAVGSLVPLLVLRPGAVFTRGGLTIFAGIGLILLGIIVSAVAGRMKEKRKLSSVQPPSGDSAVVSHFGRGLFLSILAGFGSPLINFGLAFGGPLLAHAARRGVAPESQPNVLWAPMLSAALVPYLAYCFVLFRKHGSWRLFALPGTAFHWLLGALMGALWMGSVALYGMASTRMAALGTIIGWPLFMSVIIVTADLWGIATGEWKGTGHAPLRILCCGIVLLMLGFCTIALGAKAG